jgi:hypothetical protein
MINIAMENVKNPRWGVGFFSKVLSFFFNDFWFSSFKIICPFATQPFPTQPFPSLNPP